MPAAVTITVIPVETLSSPAVTSTADRIRQLSAADITDLLREFQGAQFIVAEVGLPPIEVPLENCFEFWKDDARPHIVSSEIVDCCSFPGHYCYIASDWASPPPASPSSYSNATTDNPAQLAHR